MADAIPKIPKYFGATIPAGGSRSIDGQFKKWYIVSSTGILNIKTSFSAKQPYSERSGEEAEEGVLYERLEIFNETGADIDCVIFYGFGNFIDKRNENQGSVAVTSSALPVGGSTAAKQDTGNASLASIDGKTPALVGGAVPVSGPLTDVQLRAVAVPVSGPLTDAQLRATSVPVTVTKVGAQANAWNASVVGAGGTSAAVDTGNLSNVSAFGNSNAATTITVQVSEDNVNFYDTASNVVLVGAGNFHVSLNTGAKYVCLKSSGAATITATVSAKA